MFQILGVLCFWILAGICKLIGIVIDGAERQYQQPEPEAVYYQPLPDWQPQWSVEDTQAAEDEALDQIDDEYDYALYRMRQLMQDDRLALEAGGSYADY